MKKKININIDWKSKIIDLLIVIVGISIAFNLNTWNESRKSVSIINDYLENFVDETFTNKANLSSAMELSVTIKEDIDSLKQILILKDFTNVNIEKCTGSMMILTNFSPSTTTMDNITASGEFGSIKESDLRKSLIVAYKSYKTTLKIEDLLSEYVNTYVTPFFFENVRFSNFESIRSDFILNPKFENIVFGYEVLLSQQVQAYEDNLEKVERLEEALTIPTLNKK